MSLILNTPKKPVPLTQKQRRAVASRVKEVTDLLLGSFIDNDEAEANNSWPSAIHTRFLIGLVACRLLWIATKKSRGKDPDAKLGRHNQEVVFKYLTENYRWLIEDEEGLSS